MSLPIYVLTYLPILCAGDLKETYHMEDPREEFETVEKFPLPVTKTLVVSLSIQGKAEARVCLHSKGSRDMCTRSGNCRTG